MLAFGSLPQSGNSGGLYRYDVQGKILTEVIPESNLNPSGAGTLFPGALWFPLRYSSGQLYYQVIAADKQNSKNSNFVIYSHSTLHPELPNIKVLADGSEPIPNVGSNVIPCPPFTNPGWDISPDQTQTYPPDTTGHFVWRSDSSAFALFQFQQYGLESKTTANVYVFVAGKSDRQLLLANAQNFAWG